MMAYKKRNEYEIWTETNHKYVTPLYNIPALSVHDKATATTNSSTNDQEHQTIIYWGKTTQNNK